MWWSITTVGHNSMWWSITRVGHNSMWWSIKTFGHNSMWLSSLSIKLSPISIPPYAAAVYMNWGESVKGNNWVFLENEGINVPVTLRILQVTLLTPNCNTQQKSCLITVRMPSLNRSDWGTTRCISNTVDITDMFRVMGAATAGRPSCSVLLVLYEKRRDLAKKSSTFLFLFSAFSSPFIYV